MFVVLGEPEIIQGNIHPNVEAIGYNTSSGKHKITQIIDEYSVRININDENFPYQLTNGTSGYLEPIIENPVYDCCSDYTLNPAIIVYNRLYDTATLQYVGKPKIATYWKTGSFYGGIFDYGYWENGYWKGGIWIDGVFEKGLYDTK